MTTLQDDKLASAAKRAAREALRKQIADTANASKTTPARPRGVPGGA